MSSKKSQFFLYVFWLLESKLELIVVGQKWKLSIIRKKDFKIMDYREFPVPADEKGFRI